MKDIIYAGFAQLSYLNWHKSGIEINGEKIILENKKLKKIFEKVFADSKNAVPLHRF